MVPESTEAKLLDNRHQFPCTDSTRSDLGLHVRLDDLPQPHISEDQVPDILAEYVPFDHLDWRNPKRLLPNFGSERIATTRYGTADVNQMSLATYPPH